MLNLWPGPLGFTGIKFIYRWVLVFVLSPFLYLDLDLLGAR